MEFDFPEKNGFTVYSKSGCPNCLSVKKLIKEKHFLFKEINCDEYLIENKEVFLDFISSIAKVSCKMFPIIFYEGNFIGGLKETDEFIKKTLLSFEENF